VESTLFGHERGAFTGATARAQGAFERAHRGTLLLDEVSEMRPDIQAKLLRAIQEEEFERVGGNQPIKVDVRIVATTNRNLKAEVEAGRFRRDLYHRLHVMPIYTPPLRERLEDVPELAEYFVTKIAGQLGVKPPVLTPEALEVLCRRRWSGNIRELANAIEYALILCRDGRLTGELLALKEGEAHPAAPVTPPSATSVTAPGSEALSPTIDEASMNLEVLERLAIQRALVATGGHRTKAARILGISERTLRNKLKTT
jgi:two-component system response regulator FlrC